MPHTRPILIIEDDKDDQEIFMDAIQSLAIKHPVKFFDNSHEVISYLMSEPKQPFLIFCDINLPGLNGIQLRKEMCENEAVKGKSIPFVFLTTSASPIFVQQAYELTVQGYFQKPSSMTEMRMLLRIIFDYWSYCKHPNTRLVN
jgi:CheY-like chemotaxis protein